MKPADPSQPDSTSISSGEFELKLQRRLGSGGMGEVFEALKTNLSAGFNKKVAIKRILPKFSHDQKMIDRFLAEAKIAANLNHPNIATIYAVHFSPENPQPLIEMELIEGKTLRQLLEPAPGMGASPLPPEQAITLIQQILSAIRYAHQFQDPISGEKKRIIHADLKPRNIMVDAQAQLKLLDFGIAKALLPDEGTLSTQHCEGTPTYFSPERAQGEKPNEASDLYAVGLIYFELLTGKKFFGTDSDPRSPLLALDDAIEKRLTQEGLSEPYFSQLKQWLRHDPSQRVIPDLKVPSTPALTLTQAKREAKSKSLSARNFALAAVACIALASSAFFTQRHLRQSRPQMAETDSAARFDSIEITLQSEKRELKFEREGLSEKAQLKVFSNLACQTVHSLLLDLTRLIVVPGSESHFYRELTRKLSLKTDHLPAHYLERLTLDQTESELRKLTDFCSRFPSVRVAAELIRGLGRFAKEDSSWIHQRSPQELRKALGLFKDQAWSSEGIQVALSRAAFPPLNQEDRALIEAFSSGKIGAALRPASSVQVGSDLILMSQPIIGGKPLLTEDGVRSLLDYVISISTLRYLLTESFLITPQRMALLLMPRLGPSAAIIDETASSEGHYRIRLQLRDQDLSTVLSQGICFAQRFGESLSQSNSVCFKL